MCIRDRDETVLAICDGNEAWIEYAERQRDTVQSLSLIHI